MIWTISSRNVPMFFMIDDQEVIYLCLFVENFLGNVLIIAFQHALAFAINKKILLAGDVCSKPPITIKSHHSHACNIRGAMGEIASYHKRD